MRANAGITPDMVKGRKTKAGQAKALSEASMQAIAGAIEANDNNRWAYPVGMSTEDASAVWSMPMTFGEGNGSAFEKAVRARRNRERAGEGDLGLLGLSADDIVMLATWRAYAEQLGAHLHTVADWGHVEGVDEETGETLDCVCLVCDIVASLRDDRTTEQLLSDAEQDTVARLKWDADYVSYVYVKDEKGKTVKDEDGNAVKVLDAQGEPVIAARGRMDTRSPKAAVLKARRYYNARLALLELLQTERLPLTVYPQVGETFKNVYKELRAGYKKFSNIVRGYTIDGLISDDISYVAANLHDLADGGYDEVLSRIAVTQPADAEDTEADLNEDVYTVTRFTDRDINRRAAFDYLAGRKDLLPMQVNAVACIEFLTEGLSFNDLLTVFEFDSAGKLNALIREGQELISTAMASDLFPVYRKRAMANARREAQVA